jgi:FkbM family methyltransferase
VVSLLGLGQWLLSGSCGPCRKLARNTTRQDQYAPTIYDVRLDATSSYINGPVDFVKIDIEGSEGAVLNELHGKLHNIGAITLEYHQNLGNLAERRLEKI